MADRVEQVAIPAPVAELVAAWNDRSAERFVAVLAADAKVAVPPLHLDLEGRDDVWLAVSRVFGAFGELRYTSRHLYLAPDVATDEVLLEGLQTQEFLGAPPTGRPGAVAARVIMHHDGHVITELTMWPEVAALQQLFEGVARRIDLRTAGPAAPVVAALRATIPASEAKLSVAQGRQLPVATAPEATSALLPGAPPAPRTPASGIGGGSRGQGQDRGRKKSDVPKAPLPRKVRQRRAIAAGAAMLVIAVGLVGYVVLGVKGTHIQLAGAEPKQSASTAPSVPPTRGRGSKPSPKPPAVTTASQKAPAPAPSFDPNTSSYTIPNTVLFALGSATLLPDARQTLDQVVQGVEQDKRYGQIVVTGYTDSSGGRAINFELSKQRAGAVAEYLQGKLDLARFSVTFDGLGPDYPRAPNDTAEHRALNRRVEIKVPKSSG
ncbi:MAG TPA: OmpA family protein [Kineosporiaceae bacterium]|nr:OmpA family protein [Kineosporiaceae bacterium]